MTNLLPLVEWLHASFLERRSIQQRRPRPHLNPRRQDPGYKIWNENKPADTVYVKLHRKFYENDCERSFCLATISMNDPDFEVKLDAAFRAAERRCEVLNQWTEFRLSGADEKEIYHGPCGECGEPAMEGGYLCAKCEAKEIEACKSLDS